MSNNKFIVHKGKVIQPTQFKPKTEYYNLNNKADRNVFDTDMEDYNLHLDHLAAASDLWASEGMTEGSEWEAGGFEVRAQQLDRNYGQWVNIPINEMGEWQSRGYQTRRVAIPRATSEAYIPKTWEEAMEFAAEERRELPQYPAKAQHPHTPQEERTPDNRKFE